MKMYVNPFWFGVMATLATEVAALIIGAIISVARKKK